MTLLPVEPARVQIPPRDVWMEVEIPWGCQMPTCDQRSVHTHEVIRRSETAGPKRFVSIDGLVVLNQVRLCFFCHADVTEHRAWIRYLAGEGWVWYAAAPRPPAGGVDSIQQPKSGRWFVRVGVLKGG